MRRVEILYDFNYEALDYFEKGLNDFPGGRFEDEHKFYPVEFLKDWDNLESLNFLGAGLDKIAICDSASHQVFLIEPCSAMFFICEMEKAFEFFIKEKGNRCMAVIGAGIVTIESFFRVGSQRGEQELDVLIEFIYNDEWFVFFKKRHGTYFFYVPLILFLKAYFEFGERMIKFYDKVIPEYKNFKYYYPLFIKAVKNSVIKDEFDIKPQSGYDDLTYYDYQ